MGGAVAIDNVYNDLWPESTREPSGMTSSDLIGLPDRTVGRCVAGEQSTAHICSSRQRSG